MAIESPVPNSDWVRDNNAPTFKNPQQGLWHTEAISEALWNKYLPYQLLMLQAIKSENGEVVYKTTPWRFTLPISPQELSIDLPIATNTQATLTGIAEIHGGAPFRNIVLNGTTGITPRRGNVPSANTGNETERLMSAIFAGAVGKANAASFVNRPALNMAEEETGDGPNSIPRNSTGYYQYRLLEKFIESYVTFKSKNQNWEELGFNSRDLRLALAVWKDEAVYLCSGVQLTKRKTSSDPHLINFSLQLKAWSRVKLDVGGFNSISHSIVARDPNLMAQVLARFRLAREIVTTFGDVLEAVVFDAANTVHEIFRQTTLFMKDVCGVSQTLNDLPETIQQECVSLIIQDWNNIRKQFYGLIDPLIDEEYCNLQSKGQYTPNFKDPKSSSVIFSAISPNSLKIRPVTARRITVELRRIKQFGRSDFEEMRDSLRRISDSFATSIGASTSTYSNAYNLPQPNTAREPSRTELDILYSLNEAIIILDKLSNSSRINPPSISSIEYIAGLAERSGIAFKVPRSKFAVPFPYGYTLERLAVQYLGNANRWHEIATLNGLRAPYVDEEGFSLPLLSNGDRSQVVVADATNLFQGQTVWVSANGIGRSKRHVVRIDKVYEGNFIIALDGDQDMHRYTLNGKARLEAFLPNTVNSQKAIYIPSDNPSTEDPELRAVPGVDAFDPLLSVGGIDLLLTHDGDLVITPDGDCRLSYGLTNIVQTVKLALTTPNGTLLQHPEYGIGIPVGISSADVNPQELLRAARTYFTNDPTFSGVRSATIAKEGNTMRITLEVGIAATGQFLPITLQLNG